MGSGKWSTDAFATYSVSTGLHSARSVKDVYTRGRIQTPLDPKGIKLRESRDSADNPLSTPIIIGLDVTGSMGGLATSIAKDQLNELITKIYDEKPCTDPQLMFLAIGDSYCDSAPLQATQFESDIRIAEQLREVYFEGGGGGNDGESYNLAYYFAAKKTKTDSLDKRHQKGFLFTIGDENILDEIPRAHIKEFLGDDVDEDVKTSALLNEVQKKYEVFHLVVKPRGQDEVARWKNILGERAIEVKDVEKIPQIITDLIKLSKMKPEDTGKKKKREKKPADVVVD